MCSHTCEENINILCPLCLLQLTHKWVTGFGHCKDSSLDGITYFRFVYPNRLVIEPGSSTRQANPETTPPLKYFSVTVTINDSLPIPDPCMACGSIEIDSQHSQITTVSKIIYLFECMTTAIEFLTKLQEFSPFSHKLSANICLYHICSVFPLSVLLTHRGKILL